MSNLKQLLEGLNLRTKIDDIPQAAQPQIITFLEKERAAQAHYRIQRLFLTCGINTRQMRTFDQIDWTFNPKIPKHDVLEFRNSDWVAEARNLVLIGDTGIAKSHIAKALCHDAILKQYPTYFSTAFELVSKIKSSTNPIKKIDYYGRRIAVLCIDELGFTCHQREESDLLFQVISKRTELLPTIVTTNLSPKKWGSILSASAASVILDRLSANGHFLTWEGPSYRLHRRKK